MSIARRFEGRARLDALLERAGSLADAESVAEAFAKALDEGVPASVVISALFEDDPRFEGRHDAPALYGNLFGLWDLIASGERPDLGEKPARPPKPRPPAPPGKFPTEGPSAEWLEGAFGYLESCPDQERTKLLHAFDNRCDALITSLDESGASDAVYGAARQILFELFAMLELGGGAKAGEVPTSFKAWAQEAVFQASTDEEEALSASESKELAELVERGLTALWNGVKHGAQRARR
jgi:hypothetical protein